MAAAPSVGPTRRCSMISTGSSGSAPPSISAARSLASVAVKSPVICGGAAADADVAGDGRVDLGRGDDLVVEHDRDAALGVAGRVAGRLAGDVGPGVAALAAEVDGDEPAPTLWSALRRSRR